MSLSNFKVNDFSPERKQEKKDQQRDDNLRYTARQSAIPIINSVTRQSDDEEINIESDFDISEMDAQQQVFRNSHGKKD